MAPRKHRGDTAVAAPRYYRFRDLQALIPLGRTLLWELTRDPGFPRPVALTKGTHLWPVDEVEAWLGTALDAYLVYCKRAHSQNHSTTVTRELTKVLAPYRERRCMDVDHRLLRDVCNGSSTATVADHQRSRLRTFMKWGHEQGYFTREQTLHLEAYTYVPARPPVVRPARKRDARVHGEAERWVPPDEIPLHPAIAAAGDALGERLSYGKLLVEVIASAGTRCGEHLALPASAVDLPRREIAIDWQVLNQKTPDGGRLARPKGGKVRRTIFAEVTQTGYQLAEALDRRVWEVEKEHRAGTNPHKLLFPAVRGGYHWPGNFTNDYWTPATLEAGWEQLTWTEKKERKGKLVEVEFHQMRHTQHSLRHRFARDLIDIHGLAPAELMVVGGWESLQVVSERYYGFSSDLLDTVRAKTARS